MTIEMNHINRVKRLKDYLKNNELYQDYLHDGVKKYNQIEIDEIKHCQDIDVVLRDEELIKKAIDELRKELKGGNKNERP